MHLIQCSYVYSYAIEIHCQLNWVNQLIDLLYLRSYNCWSSKMINSAMHVCPADRKLPAIIYYRNVDLSWGTVILFIQKILYRKKPLFHACSLPHVKCRSPIHVQRWKVVHSVDIINLFVVCFAFTLYMSSISDNSYFHDSKSRWMDYKLPVIWIEPHPVSLLPWMCRMDAYLLVELYNCRHCKSLSSKSIMFCWLSNMDIISWKPI